MQFIDLLTLIWDARNDMGLGTILVYLMPVVAILALIGELIERRYFRDLEVRAQDELIREARLVKRDHDREVAAWVTAARQSGERRL